MRIAFHGADRSVTGSCHLVECAGTRLVVDCGLYQGGREIEEENAKPFGFDPRKIDLLLLTHAHLDHCGRIPLLVNQGIRATFLDAGHILGSASVLLELEEGDRRRKVLFSGDLGSGGRPILRDPSPPPPVEVVVLETTYGDRLHRPLGPSVEELYQAIAETFRRGGNVIIPTFALERAQELLYFLREGVEAGRLPRSMPVFLDSPMAISATEIFERHPECYDTETAGLFQSRRDPFALPGLRLTRQATESMAINRVTGGAVVMAGSGMCSGGRVRHHLRHNLGRARNSVVFVGYAARGTLARRIVDGASSVSIFGEEVPVRAQVHTIGGFSAHADRAELLAWHGQTGARRTFLVHGEEEVMRCFAGHLEGAAVELPALHQDFAL